MSQFFYDIRTIHQPWLADVIREFGVCDALTEKAEFQTGSISEAAGYYLRSLCDELKPRTVIEVGTFIGKSTMAMLLEPSIQHLYTCDMHNNCLLNTPRLTCFPKTLSTKMLGQLVEKGVKADFFFFDGRLSPADIALILRLSKWNTIYAFDDYDFTKQAKLVNEATGDVQYGPFKGIFNIDLLEPYLREHVLIDPPDRVGDLDSQTAIAVLMPKELV